MIFLQPHRRDKSLRVSTDNLSLENDNGKVYRAAVLLFRWYIQQKDVNE